MNLLFRFMLNGLFKLSRSCEWRDDGQTFVMTMMYGDLEIEFSRANLRRRGII